MKEEEERVREILRRLGEAYPDAPPTYLDHRNTFEMTIATILSAHTADKAVNMILPELFGRYPDPKAMMKASLKDLGRIIRPCGTYNRKAAFLQNASSMLVKRFSGEIPQSMDDLTSLPGVSRKTANVILSVCFGINEGIVVDTHIMRVTQRLGISRQKVASKIEQELMGQLSRDKWYDYARLIGAHGRRTCTARKPACPACAVNSMCPSAQLNA